MTAPTLLRVSLQDEPSAGIPHAGISDGAVRHRRSYRYGRQPTVRVILASGYSDQEISQRFQNAGLAGFIEKPYRAETLGAKLREVLAQHC